MADKYEVLKNVYGYDSFRPAQEKLIDNILSGRDVLGVMPTGAGKSICFQIPALMLDGITLVISPLISLMSDQVTALTQAGVRAAYLNSSLSAAQQRQVITNIRRGIYKIIYVAPERLETESFAGVAGDIHISMIAVDEAHCISQWGQDFRPSYMNIVSFAASLPYRPIISAFTATATERVRDDIVSILKLDDPYTVITGFDRTNLYFGVEEAREGSRDGKYRALKRLIDSYGGRSGIVYCATRKNVELVSEKLIADGISAAAYHAGLSDEQRRRSQEDFIFDRVRVIVATNAFGMGIDKSNVSFVIHYNMPKDMESYYQEAGRAGRDGEPADCILLYSRGDYQLNKFIIERGSEESEIDEDMRRRLISRDMKRLGRMMDYCESSSCLRGNILKYFGESGMTYCGNCSVCTGDHVKTDITVEAQKIISCVYRMGQRYGVSTVKAVLCGSESEKITANSLDKLTTYGIMKDVTKNRLDRIMKYLISDGYLRQEGEEYPIIKLTAKSAPVLKGEEKLFINLPAEKTKETKSRSRTEEFQLDQGLMQKLKELRRQLAAKEKVPAFTVFSDATLRDMCAKRPKSRGEMLNVAGVGSVKLERYGAAFIDAINEWISENGSGTPLSAEDTRKLESPLHAVAERISRFSPSEEPCSLTQLCDMLIDASGINVQNRAVRTAVGKWLTDGGYLEDSKDSKGIPCKETTWRSGQIGIQKVTKIGSGGTLYSAVVYDKKAQKFVADHINEIADIEL